MEPETIASTPPMMKQNLGLPVFVMVVLILDLVLSVLCTLSTIISSIAYVFKSIPVSPFQIIITILSFIMIATAFSGDIMIIRKKISGINFSMSSIWLSVILIIAGLLNTLFFVNYEAMNTGNLSPSTLKYSVLISFAFSAVLKIAYLVVYWIAVSKAKAFLLKCNPAQTQEAN